MKKCKGAACQEWVERSFSFIPEKLIKAYSKNIEEITPWTEEEIESEYHEIYAMWGTYFSPTDFDAMFIKKHLEEVKDIGFRIWEDTEGDLYLGIDGCGYDFYEHHWLPLYDLFGVKWHECEE